MPPAAKETGDKGDKREGGRKKKAKEEVKELSPEETCVQTMETQIKETIGLSRAAYFGQGKLLSDLLAAMTPASASGELAVTDDIQGQPPLLLAAMNGHLKAIKAMLDKGASVNIRGYQGLTALHLACRNDFVDVVQFLCTEGKADTEIADEAGNTPIFDACRNGNLMCVSALLDTHANSEHANTLGNTPLLSSCTFARPAIVDLLLRRKCNVAKQNSQGDTALHLACKLSLVPIAQYLLEAGASQRVTNTEGLKAREVCSDKRLLALLDKHEAQDE